MPDATPNVHFTVPFSSSKFKFLFLTILSEKMAIGVSVMSPFP